MSVVKGTIGFDPRTDEIIVRCQPHVAIKLRRFYPGVRRGDDNAFRFDRKSETAFDLEWFRIRYPMEILPDAIEGFNALVKKHQVRLDSIAEIDVTGYVPPVFELAIPPRDYQRLAADLAIRNGSLLVADELGTGKTVTGICTLVAEGALPALVVTMTHLTRQWASELARFAPKLRVHRIKHGTPYEFTEVHIKREGKRRTVVKGPSMPDVLIMNYNKLTGWRDHLAGKMNTVIFDEAAELRRHDSQKHEAAVAVALDAKTRVAMTATPVYNYGEEIHSVISVIDPDALGSRTEFTREWCSGPKNAVDDPRALGVYLRERGVMIRRTRAEIGREIAGCDVIRHVVDADTEHIQREENSVAELARKILAREGSNLELMQAAGDIDWRLRQATGIAKAHAVADFVRILVDSGERVLLGGWHRAVYDVWRRDFDAHHVPFAYFTGEETDSQKAESIARFKSGAAQVLVMSLRSGAGLDGLQHVCRTAVLGELDWSPKVHEQFIGRLHRDGQQHPVCAYYLVAEQGSDPVVEDILGIKEVQASGIQRPYDDQPISVLSTADNVDRIKKLAASILARKREAVGLSLVT